MCIEKYYLYSQANKVEETLVNNSITLISDYLAIPEGKLCSSKGKIKALNWLEKSKSSECGEGKMSSGISSREIYDTKFILMDVNLDDNSISLMSCIDECDLRENIQVENDDLFQKICTAFDVGEVTIDYDASIRTVKGFTVAEE